MSTITRQQLKDLGCSEYLAKKVTLNLPYTHQERRRVYPNQGVLKNVQELVNKGRIRQQTLKAFNVIINTLQNHFLSPEEIIQALPALQEPLMEIEFLGKRLEAAIARSEAAKAKFQTIHSQFHQTMV